jgi:hypothetical protein
MQPSGRATANPTDPRAFAVCQRCGFLWNHEDLQWQFQWAGSRLMNTNLLVCDPCLDVPNEQLRVIKLMPDPVSIEDARPEQFTVDEAGPASSQIAVDAEQGATTIFVEDVSGFSASDTVYVQLNNGTFAQETVVSVDTVANSMVVSIPLPYAASTDGIVSAAAD